jgi:hypothetical protein
MKNPTVGKLLPGAWFISLRVWHNASFLQMFIQEIVILFIVEDKLIMTAFMSTSFGIYEEHAIHVAQCRKPMRDNDGSGAGVIPVNCLP